MQILASKAFFQFSDMSVIGDRFCIYHINAPGQEEDAESFLENFIYPTLDDLAETVADVVKHFHLKRFIGFGVGAGANIFCRYALKHPKVLDALILANCSCSTSGWIEWGYQKANMFSLRSKGMSNLTVDYLMWHHFGRNFDQYSPELITSYKQYFTKLPHPKNLAGFIESYIKRSALPIRRHGSTLDCPVLQIVGAGSPHVNDTVELNKRLDPTISNWMKISDCSGMVLEEKPEKVTEAILLFLQGQGHFPFISHLKWRENRSNSIIYPQGQRSMSICAPMMTVRQEGKADVIVGRRSYSLATPDSYAAVRQFIEKSEKKPLRKMETTAEENDETVNG